MRRPPSLQGPHASELHQKEARAPGREPLSACPAAIAAVLGALSALSACALWESVTKRIASTLPPASPASRKPASARRAHTAASSQWPLSSKDTAATLGASDTQTERRRANSLQASRLLRPPSSTCFQASLHSFLAQLQPVSCTFPPRLHSDSLLAKLHR